MVLGASRTMSVRNRKRPEPSLDEGRSADSESSTDEATTGETESSATASSSWEVLTEVERPWPPVVEEAPSWPTNLSSAPDPCARNPASRLLHWGPLTALFIIGFISATTTHFIMMWWPMTTAGGLAHFFVFMVWNYLTLANMCSASFLGGGYGPKKWMPPKPEQTSELQFCKPCEGYKAPRAHHCSKCGRCVMKMDHHCPWINNCVGHVNHAYFCRFLASAIVGCVHALVIHIICGYHLFHQKLTEEQVNTYQRDVATYLEKGYPRWLARNIFMHSQISGWYLRFGNGTEPLIHVTFTSLISLVAASAFSFGVTIGLAGLLFMQLKGIRKNKTGIEEYIDTKAKHRYEDDETDTQWFYPYDLGWRRNFKEVLGNWNGTTNGNGIWWPVAEPCDQFTLTREQLAQKKAKRKMARLVKITDDFAGGVFGSCRLGCRIFFCQPISEDARVKVSKGERWVITQGTKHWFYGHKQFLEDGQKGWFPRCVAKLLDERPY